MHGNGALAHARREVELAEQRAAKLREDIAAMAANQRAFDARLAEMEAVALKEHYKATPFGSLNVSGRAQTIIEIRALFARMTKQEEAAA